MGVVLRVVNSNVIAPINYQVSAILCNCIHLGFHQLGFQALAIFHGGEHFSNALQPSNGTLSTLRRSFPSLSSICLLPLLRY